jgi:hypothetical protein
METNQPMPANVRQALARVVAYNWPDELRDFRGSAESDHIFRALVTVDNYLNGTERPAEDYRR